MKFQKFTHKIDVIDFHGIMIEIQDRLFWRVKPDNPSPAWNSIAVTLAYYANEQSNLKDLLAENFNSERENNGNA